MERKTLTALIGQEDTSFFDLKKKKVPLERKTLTSLIGQEDTNRLWALPQVQNPKPYNPKP